MELLLHFGTPAQQERYLKPLVQGDIRSCFAMTEPERAGSNPTWLNATAQRDGDSWVINGHKWFVSSADGAAFTVIMAVTDPDATRPHHRASLIIVPLDTPGLNHIRRIKTMGEEGEDWHSHSELRFENCRVPLENVVGESGQGFALAQQRLGPGRVHHCMRWIGICERALDLICRRAASREIAPGVLLAAQQSVQHAIAESRVEINAARLMISHVADNYAARGSKELRVEISAIKYFTANVLQRVIDRAIQVHGALGVTDDLLLAYWYRHERCARIYDGADEVHKNVVAREVLKGYGVQI
jgi:alkylation response protein AidB-like acyl-CoA dehydrogenase